MKEERLIEILNDLVAVEIAAVTEYQQHAYLSEDPATADLMEDLSMDEMAHIEWCSREVAQLGGMPTVVPRPVRHVDKTFEDLVRRDIEVEAEAMRRLKEYIKVAEKEGEPRIKKLLQDIHADEETHYDILSGLLNPPRSFLGKMKTRFMDIGSGLILTGLFWLYFWIFQWYIFFLFDPRWAHNFAYPLILITIGVAYKGKKMSSDLLAAVSAFMIIPTETGIISGIESTYTAIVLLTVTLLLLVAERGRKQELLIFQHRWRRWLKKHLLTFTFLFLMHMAFIYFAMRMFAPQLMEANLPPEPPWEPTHWSTASYNILVIPFGLIGMAERFRGTLRRRITASKIGYWWSLMIIIVGVAAINLASGEWLRYSPPLIAAIVILALSLIAKKS